MKYAHVFFFFAIFSDVDDDYRVNFFLSLHTLKMYLVPYAARFFSVAVGKILASPKNRAHLLRAVYIKRCSGALTRVRELNRCADSEIGNSVATQPWYRANDSPICSK